MKKFIRLGLPLIAVAILSVAVFASCGNPKGKLYKNTANNTQTLEFLGDNTVLINSGSSTAVATYRVTGNIVIIYGTTNVFRIVDQKTLLQEGGGPGAFSPAGTRWVKM